MLYLIGGAPRVGKSLFLEKLIIANPMPSFSCDFLYDLEQVRKLEEFTAADILTKGRLFFPTFNELLLNVTLRSESCAIEGEVILPEHIPQLREKYEVKCCFLGLSETSLESILEYAGYFNWPQYKLQTDRDQEVIDLAERTMSRSKVIKDQCETYGLPYFDLAADYSATMEVALASLVS
jgi:hypothetical protein